MTAILNLNTPPSVPRSETANNKGGLKDSKMLECVDRNMRSVPDLASGEHMFNIYSGLSIFRCK